MFAPHEIRNAPSTLSSLVNTTIPTPPTDPAAITSTQTTPEPHTNSPERTPWVSWGSRSIKKDEKQSPHKAEEIRLQDAVKRKLLSFFNLDLKPTTNTTTTTTELVLANLSLSQQCYSKMSYQYPSTISMFASQSFVNQCCSPHTNATPNRTTPPQHQHHQHQQQTPFPNSPAMPPPQRKPLDFESVVAPNSPNHEVVDATTIAPTSVEEDAKLKNPTTNKLHQNLVRILNFVQRKREPSHEKSAQEVVATDKEIATTTSNARQTEQERWINATVSDFESGIPAERVQACEMLQNTLKGAHAAMCRDVLAGCRIVPQLLLLSQHPETAKAAIYTLQLVAATPRAADPVKMWMEECGCIATFVTMTLEQRINKGGLWESLEDCEKFQTVSHILATLLNLCIGSPERKNKCVQSKGFVRALNDLLFLERFPAVQQTAANVVSSMAIGSPERKEILGTDRMIAGLARLVSPDKPLALQYQAVVAMRAVMHGNLERQMQAAQQPAIIQHLSLLLPSRKSASESLTSLFINRGVDQQKLYGKQANEVMIALHLLRHAKVEAEKASQADDECSMPDEDMNISRRRKNTHLRQRQVSMSLKTSRDAVTVYSLAMKLARAVVRDAIVEVVNMNQNETTSE